MKRLLLFLFLLQNFFAIAQSTTLYQGDIAIIGFNFKNPDEFSFISFVELRSGTIIYFTDSGWTHDNTFRSGEGLITYEVPPGGKKAMEVITYPNDIGFTTAGVSGFFGFSVEGDQLFAFQGSWNNPVFLFGMDSSEHPWIGDAIDNNTSALPPQLVSNGMHVEFHQVINAMYDCNLETTSLVPLLKQSVLSVSNWNTSPNRFTLPVTCFDNALTITLIDFEIVESLNNYYARFELFSDEASMVYLEESIDGINFYPIDSIRPIIGYQEYTFSKSLSKTYYRLHLQGEWNGSYSKIIMSAKHHLEVVEEVTYSIQGVVRNDVKESGLYFIKKLYSDGSFVVEKVIIDKENQ